ncbi:2-oxo acid dehydrogenase subunit E2, partial [bacterium]|nr:2-oxo acid dehydrogenase subunit E2 [bacterium]
MFHVKFADIGEGIHEGVLLKLFFNEGDSVKEGDSLFTLETDKVNAEIPSPATGILKSNKYKVGAKVNVGDVIVIVDDGKPGMRSNMEGGEVLAEAGVADDKSSELPIKADAPYTESVQERGSTAVVGQIEISDSVIASSGEMTTKSESASEQQRVLATPVARKMAKDLGVDIHKVIGTGPQGRVMKNDIQMAADSQGDVSKLISVSTTANTAVPSPTSSPAHESYGRAYPKTRVPELENSERVAMSMLRKTIANNMSLSKFTIPHTAVMDEIDVTELVTFREQAKQLAATEGAKLTYLAFFIKAVISGLKVYKGLNASLDEEAEEIVFKHFYNIGIAVDT